MQSISFESPETCENEEWVGSRRSSTMQGYVISDLYNMNAESDVFLFIFSIE